MNFVLFLVGVLCWKKIVGENNKIGIETGCTLYARHHLLPLQNHSMAIAIDVADQKDHLLRDGGFAVAFVVCS
jgi:hypothetical protein